MGDGGGCFKNGVGGGGGGGGRHHLAVTVITHVNKVGHLVIKGTCCNLQVY